MCPYNNNFITIDRNLIDKRFFQNEVQKVLYKLVLIGHRPSRSFDLGGFTALYFKLRYIYII